MRTKIYLPKTMQELKELNHNKQSLLWARYVPHPYKRQVRALWYYIHCENANLKIEIRHMQKIRKYMNNPDECVNKAYRLKYNLMPGSEMIRKFHGAEHRVVVGDPDGFLYNNKTYRTLSAIAKEICGIKVSGYDFFGLDTKKAKGLINCKQERVYSEV